MQTATRWHTHTCTICHRLKILRVVSLLRVSSGSVHMVVSRTSKHTRTHTAVSNSKSMKHSMCFLPGGAERYAITGGPRRELSYSSCMYETNTVPIIRSQASLLMWSISKARLCSLQPGKRERGREREINTPLTSQRWLGTSQSGATRVDRSKVGLTTSPRISLCCFILLSHAKEDNNN